MSHNKERNFFTVSLEEEKRTQISRIKIKVGKMNAYLMGLLFSPLLIMYCRRIGFTNISSGSISRSGNSPNSVQKNMN
jgi:hypothetical protein